MSLGKFQQFKRLTDIPPALLAESGVKCVMMDMDSTLMVWHGECVAPEEEKWCRDIMGMGIKIVLVSNAIKERAKKIAGMLGADFIFPAMKPLPFGLWHAASKARTKRRQCVMIGDQLLTDKLAARLAGISFILVEPLSDVEFGLTKLNRKAEKFFFGRDTGK